MAAKRFTVLATLLAVIYVQAESESLVKPILPLRTLIAPATTSSETGTPLKQKQVSSEVIETQTRDKRAPVLLGKAALGGALLGAGVLGAGALGAGALGVGVLGAGAVGAGLYGAKRLSGHGREYGYNPGYHYHNHYHNYPQPYPNTYYYSEPGWY